MPVLLVLLALFVPRLVVLILWLFTEWFAGLFDLVLWPILGFLFLPTTLLWFTVVQHWFDGQWTLWPIVGLVIALLIDMSPGRRWGEGPRPREKRRTWERGRARARAVS